MIWINKNRHVELKWEVRRRTPLELRKQPSKASYYQHLCHGELGLSAWSLPSIDWRWYQWECRRCRMALDCLPRNTREFEILVEKWWGTLEESRIEQEVNEVSRKGAVGLEFTHRNRRLSVVGGDWILTTNLEVKKVGRAARQSLPLIQSTNQNRCMGRNPRSPRRKKDKKTSIYPKPTWKEGETVTTSGTPVPDWHWEMMGWALGRCRPQPQKSPCRCQRLLILRNRG